MEESWQQHRMHGFLQSLCYGLVVLDIVLCTGWLAAWLPGVVHVLAEKLQAGGLHAGHIKAGYLALLLISVAGSRPSSRLAPGQGWRYVLLPIVTAMFFLGISMYLYIHQPLTGQSASLMYAVSTFASVFLMHLAGDNAMKHVRTKLARDPWNIENESFDQQRKCIRNAYSINYKTLFRYKGRLHRGWLNITEPFRGTLLIGTPGAGKTYSIINPYIVQWIGRGYAAVIYDFKYPDLTQVALQAYQDARKKGHFAGGGFHVVHGGNQAISARVNPLDRRYIQSLADALETAETLVYALKKSEAMHGAEQFFTQSAINLLACIFYYNATQSDHSNLAGALKLLGCNYALMFETLSSCKELTPLLIPFKTAYENKAFEQLEGQLGTLRIQFSRLSSPELQQIFSHESFQLDINSYTRPSVVVLASSPQLQSTTSAAYALLVNRILHQINQKDRHPCAVIVDEAPTLYLHRIEQLIATARSNRVAVLLGLQDLSQLRQYYSKTVADTICAVLANVIAGQVQHKETLDWLERLFGRKVQVKYGENQSANKHSLSASESLEPLIPAAKIAQLSTGEFVGRVAGYGKGEKQFHCQVDHR